MDRSRHVTETDHLPLPLDWDTLLPAWGNSSVCPKKGSPVLVFPCSAVSMGPFACRTPGVFVRFDYCSDVKSGEQLSNGISVLFQDFILEHYSEDADKYIGAIQDFTDIRQVSHNIWTVL